jgi:CheY-like chemotaxis protein
VRVTARRILLVDDNHDGARLLGDILASVGHDVAVAHDGPSALAMLARFTPEIAVLDIGLPVMDGYELAAALRDRFGAGLRLIAVTGYGQDHDVQRARVAGFEHHFVKPLAIARLLGALELDQAPR